MILIESHKIDYLDPKLLDFNNSYFKYIKVTKEGLVINYISSPIELGLPDEFPVTKWFDITNILNKSLHNELIRSSVDPSIKFMFDGENLYNYELVIYINNIKYNLGDTIKLYNNTCNIFYYSTKRDDFIGGPIELVSTDSNIMVIDTSPIITIQDSINITNTNKLNNKLEFKEYGKVDLIINKQLPSNISSACINTKISFTYSK